MSYEEEDSCIHILQEALEYFLKAEGIQSGFWLKNQLNIAKSYVQIKDVPKAKVNNTHTHTHTHTHTQEAQHRHVLHACHMRRRIHACHMRRRIHASRGRPTR
jgi:hypothetical protein